MLHSEARKQKGPSDEEDGDKGSAAAIVMLAGAIASKHQSAQPSAIDFIRVYPDTTIYSVGLLVNDCFLDNEFLFSPSFFCAINVPEVV